MNKNAIHPLEVENTSSDIDKTDTALSLRTPPHNIEAEMIVIGTILANNKAFESVSEFLKADHFSSKSHRKIYEVIVRLLDKGQIVSPVTLANYFEQSGFLSEIGGKQFLAKLVGFVSHIVNIKDYGQLLYDLYLRRQLIDLGQNIVNGAYHIDPEISAMSQIESSEQKLYNLAEQGIVGNDFKPLEASILEAIHTAEQAFKRDSHITGVTSGLTDLDKKLGGFHSSDLIILAGRPSMGKTALATKLAFEAAAAYKPEAAEEAQEGAKVAFFSLEMSAEQLATRLLSEQTKISSDKIRRGEIQNQDFEKFVEASHNLSNLQLYIDDTPGLTISAIRNRARRLKRQKGLGMVVIDYLQLVQASHSSAENRVQAVSEITRGLKILAKELNVPVLALSQLSRGPEQRDDKRPQLSDLRESGSIEQDADVVMFIFREEYYLAREQPPEGTEKHMAWQSQMAKVHNVSEVIVAKQRHGPIGTVKLYFDGAHTTFKDYIPDTNLPEGM